MIKVSIQYPNAPDIRFDFDHYMTKHMPWSIELLSAHPGYRGVSVERGLFGTDPNQPPAYVAACFFLFDSVESFIAAFMPHAEALQRDITNYSNITPQIQFNEVHWTGMA